MLRSDTPSHAIKIDNKLFEYPLVDTYRTLSGKEVKIEMHWEHMPVVGPILKKKLEIGTYTLPERVTSTPDRSILRREIDYEDEE